MRDAHIAYPPWGSTVMDRPMGHESLLLADRAQSPARVKTTTGSAHRGPRRALTPRRLAVGGLALTLAIGVLAVARSGSGGPGWCDTEASLRDDLESGSADAWRTLRDDLPPGDKADANAVVAALDTWASLSTRPASFADAGEHTTALGDALPRLQGHAAESCTTDLPAPLLAPASPTAS